MAGRWRGGQQSPKIQVWRVNETYSNVYYKSGPDVVFENSVCVRNINQQPAGVFHCILSEVSYVSVRPGDILGLELPPADDDGFEPYFTSGGPMNYVFQDQLSSVEVNLSEAHSVSHHLPLINLLVVLGILPPTCLIHKACTLLHSYTLYSCTHIIYVCTTLLDTVTDRGSMLSPCYIPTTTPLNQTTSQMNISLTTRGKISTPETTITLNSPEASSSTAVVTGSVVGGIAVVLLVVTVILMVMFLVQRKKQKKQKGYSGSGLSINNYWGMSMHYAIIAILNAYNI